MSRVLKGWLVNRWASCRWNALNIQVGRVEECCSSLSIRSASRWSFTKYPCCSSITFTNIYPILSSPSFCYSSNCLPNTLSGNISGVVIFSSKKFVIISKEYFINSWLCPSWMLMADPCSFCPRWQHSSRYCIVSQLFIPILSINILSNTVQFFTKSHSSFLFISFVFIYKIFIFLIFTSHLAYFFTELFQKYCVLFVVHVLVYIHFKYIL